MSLLILIEREGGLVKSVFRGKALGSEMIICCDVVFGEILLMK